MASLTTAALSKDRNNAEGLLGSVAVFPGTRGVWVANSMEVLSFVVTADDVVLRGAEVGLVKACCSHNGQLCVFVEPMARVRALSTHTDVVRCTGELVVWQAMELCLALAWRRSDAFWHVVRM